MSREISMDKSSRPRRTALDRKGFTLVELLVAMAVLSLLVVMLMGLVDSATTMWQSNENRIESYREARVAMSMMANELRFAHISTNENWFHFVEENGSGDSEIGFLTALPISSQDPESLGQICSIGYFLAEGNLSDLDVSAGRTWNLYRLLKESNETHDLLEASPESPDLWTDEVMAPEDVRAEIVARNIRSFRVRAFRRTGNSWVPWTHAQDHPMPDLLEIEIQAVNSDTSKRLDGNLKGPALDNSPGEIRTLTTRIPLRKLPTPTQGSSL